MHALAAADKAQILIEALPYIRAYRNQRVVVKIGGAALDDPRLSKLVAQDLALLALVGIKLIVVHGGGPQVSEAMSSAGLEPRFVNGLRVTDAASMDIVKRVLIGSINSDLVAGLSDAGLKAVGLSGADGSLLEAEAISEELGLVGRVTQVNDDLLTALLDDDYTPVIASVAQDGAGAFLNVNADSAACAIALAIGAAKLVYMTNVEGLYADLGDKESLISELKSEELAAMTGSLSEGMRPKAESSVEALRSGIGKVHILDGRDEHALLLEIFTDEGIGTQVLP